MDSEESPPPGKKNYDDISYEKRENLIDLIMEKKWTIRAAARHLGIKHSTAKHILYLYRKKGKIVKKKPKPNSCCHHCHLQQPNPQTQTPEPQYILVPYPVYVVCSSQTSQVPINLEHNQVLL